MDDSSTRRPVAIPTVVSAVLGVAAFVFLTVLLPLAWWLAPVPIALTRAATVGYLFAMAILCALLVVWSVTRRRLAISVSLVFIFGSMVIGLLAVGQAIARVSEGFDSVETLELVPAPSGDLEVVHQYVDQGALGGFSEVYVRGRLIPGIASWRYEFALPPGYVPGDVSWVDERTVSIGGMHRRVPVVVALTAW